MLHPCELPRKPECPDHDGEKGDHGGGEGAINVPCIPNQRGSLLLRLPSLLIFRLLQLGEAVVVEPVQVLIRDLGEGAAADGCSHSGQHRKDGEFAGLDLVERHACEALGFCGVLPTRYGLPDVGGEEKGEGEGEDGPEGEGSEEYQFMQSHVVELNILISVHNSKPLLKGNSLVHRLDHDVASGAQCQHHANQVAGVGVALWRYLQAVLAEEDPEQQVDKEVPDTIEDAPARNVSCVGHVEEEVWECSTCWHFLRKPYFLYFLFLNYLTEFY